jgi:UDP-N-acetyl-D-mannosaminuronic acid transferase (WecB/TagA/CpsF family)
MTTMNALADPPVRNEDYRNILDVRFFVGEARRAVELGARGGLMVAPAAPALLDLERDRDYRRALRESDLAITDSGFLVLLWNLLGRDRIQRVSGLEYLELLLARPEFQRDGSSFWVMPSQASLERNVSWLRGRGRAVRSRDCYVAPNYGKGVVTDDVLADLIDQREPRHVIICLGGGVQEKLGSYLKRHCATQPAIHCIGAAIGFLSGDQVRIPRWADAWVLGWLFRCAADPRRFIPRYARAFQLAGVLWRYRRGMARRAPEPGAIA